MFSFDRSLKGIGRLRVSYSSHHGFDSTKTPIITFDLSACIMRFCNAAGIQSEVLMELWNSFNLSPLPCFSRKKMS